MTPTNMVASRSVRMPAELQIAQNAIDLPEVQEMLRKLSKYNLGIYMPHMHDDDTGEFRPLPTGFTQVEDALKVSFEPADQVADTVDRSYVPIGWFWVDGAHPMAVCTNRCVLLGPMHTSGHESKPDDPDT